ncbi:MAG TPA: serine hydrolase domain-containing protein [Gammaproteobacteria bacterium]|jgi:CubicO group peptidase (beta-lactamase class C family)
MKTRKLTTALSTAALCLPLFAAAQTVAPQQVGLSAERLERIGDVVDGYIEAGDITGAVTLVAKDGRIAHLEAHGIMDIASKKPMTTDAMFRIASMSKPIGAVSILMLIEEGKIRLSDPVSRFIPAYKDMHVAVAQPRRPAFGPPGSGPPPSAPPAAAPAGPGGPPPEFYTVPAERDITILDLLTHTSGLMSGPMSNSVTQPFFQGRHETGVAYTEEVGTAPLEFQPGARWAYSAVGGFDVLSRVVEIVSGQSFSDFTRARIFGPLGMSDTTFWPTSAQRARLVTSYIRRNNELVPRENPDDMSGDRYFSAAGGVMTTARDYAQLAMMLANGGELNGRRILSRRSVELMGSVFVPDTLQGRRPGEAFGLGVRVITDPAARGTWLSAGSFGWDGVYGTRFWVDPKENLVGIIFTQTTVVPLLNDFETAVMQAVD